MEEQITELCDTFTKVGIMRECEKRGLPTAGNKMDLAERIIIHDATMTANNEEEADGGGVAVNNDEKKDSSKRADETKGVDDDSRSTDDEDDVPTDDDGGTKFFTPSAKMKSMASTPMSTRFTSPEPRPYSFRDVEDSIEAFGADDGQDVKMWMNQFESMANTAYWNDDQKLIMCRKKLVGTARRFVFSQRDLTSFPKLKSALICEFSPFVRASDVHRMLAGRKKKPMESTRDYIYEMQRIALAIDLDELSVCEYIVDGVTDDEFHRSLLYGAHSIRELKEKLLNFEKAQKKTEPKPKSDDGVGRKRERQKQDSAKQSSKAEVKRHCFNCGDVSHVASECPQKNDGPKCFGCNSFGHLSKDCSVKKKKDGDKKAASKVNVLQNVNIGKPRVTMKLFGREFSAIIDTGSEISLIRKDLWAELSRIGARMEKSTMKVRGYGGEVNAVCGETNLNVVIEDEDYVVRFYVVPIDAIDMQLLVGMDFLNGVDYSITPDGARVKKYSPTSDESEQCEAKWIRCVEEFVGENEITVPYQYREEVVEMVENYNPKNAVVAANKLKITLKDNDVVCENPRRLAQLEKEVVKKQIGEWIEGGIIQPSESEYASPVVVVPKKDGSYRVCVDYREINKKVVRDKFPMPNVEEQIDRLSEARVYTTLDLKNSYFHVPVDESGRKYTAFVTSDGQYEFLRAPFGLCTSGNAFGRFIAAVFKDLTQVTTSIIS